MDREIALKWSSLTGKKRDKTATLSRIMKLLLSSMPSTGTRNPPLQLLVCDPGSDFLLLLSALTQATHMVHLRGSEQERLSGRMSSTKEERIKSILQRKKGFFF